MTLPERLQHSEALILRRMDYGEADYLITLFTPNYGKLKTLAKNVRKPANRQAGQVELYSHIRFMLKRGREDLHIITQAETLESYAVLREEVERHIWASHVVELLDQFMYEGEEQALAFDLLRAVLGWLCDLGTDPRLAVHYYEYQLLRQMGFEPSVFDCAVSGETLTPEDHYFSVSEGGVVKREFVAGLDVIPLSLPVFKILRHFSRQPWEIVRVLQPSSEHYADLDQIMGRYFTYILERRLKSTAILDQIRAKR